MLVGLRINVSMMIGGVLAWVVAPYFLVKYGVALGRHNVIEAGHEVSRAVFTDTPTRTKVLFWVMWPATGMLVAGGLTALALRWRLLVDTFRSLRSREDRLGRAAADHRRARRGDLRGRAVHRPARDARHAGVDDARRDRAVDAADARRAARPRRDQLGPDQRAVEHDAGRVRGDRAGQRRREHGRQRHHRHGRHLVRGDHAGLQVRRHRSAPSPAA